MTIIVSSTATEACPTPTAPAPAAPPPVKAAPGSYELVAIDLDGTLLTSDKRLTAPVIEAIGQTVRRGVRIVLASARPPRSVRPIYQRLGLDTPQVNYNGALIHDEPNNRTLLHQPLPTKLAWQIVKLARKTDPKVVVSVETLDKWYTDHNNPTLPTETSRHFAPDFVGPLEAFLHKPATKLMLLAPPARLGRIKAAIAWRFSRRVSLIICDPHLIQIIAPMVDKSVALQQVAASFGVRRENVMAIGDAPNDEGMIRWAGLGVAMANAWQKVRAAADAVAPGNDEDGVAAALREYVLT